MVVVLSVAGLLAIGAGNVPGPRTAMRPIPAAIGEHSALGELLVAGLNAAIASLQTLRGEHAGLTREDYEAGAGLDGSGH
jgi:hypothetical protein